MKKITRYFLASLLLVSLIGCNESTSNTTDKETQSIKVSLSIPSENTKTNEKGFFKSFTTDTQSVLLQVFKQGIEGEKLQTKSMTKDANGIWAIDLVLNSDDAPFKFRALAYQTVVTPETETANTPIFTGQTSTVTNNEAVIVLTETDESIAESTRKLPLLDSVDTVINADSSIGLTFNLTYATGGTVTYALSSVANDGTGLECTTSLFTPSTGSIDFDTVTSFTSALVPDSATCENPKHFILLTTPTSDTLKVPFTVDANTLAVNIALPAVISNINVVDNGTSFDLDVVVENSDTLTLSYAWSFVEGTGTFDTQTAQTNLSGFDRASALVVLIAVTNDVTGAVSSIAYELVATSGPAPITRAELDALIASGADVTKVNTSEITDMSRLFENNTNFNQDISDWDVSSITNMEGMFAGADVFNQDISDWVVSSVTNMSNMFNHALIFNQNISTWNVDNITNSYQFSTDSALILTNHPTFPSLN